MKRLVVLLACLVSVFGRVTAQTYGLGNADPALFTKFRIPATDMHSLTAGSNFNFSSGKSSVLYPNLPNSDNENSSLSFYLAPHYYVLKESDDRFFSMDVGAAGNYDWSYTNSEGQNAAPNNYVKNWADQLDLSASEVYRIYPDGGAAFYSIGSSAEFNYSDNYHDVRTSDSTREVLYGGTKRQDYGFTLGIGWGKMRNVTPVVSAIRFQERLKQLNLLNGDLSESTIEDLAQQFYREGYFSGVYVRPDKFFWQDVQRTLSRDGVSLDGLNQYADSYIREVPGELRFMRNEGMLAGINLALNYGNNYNTSSGIQVDEQFYAEGEAYFQYSHQLDLNSELSFSASLTGGPNLSKNAWVRQVYEGNAAASYHYELTDRLVASVNESFNLTFYNAAQPQRIMTDQASAALNYFVEDNVSFQVSYSWNYSNQRSQGLPFYDQITNITNGSNVSFGLTYYIDRSLMLN